MWETKTHCVKPWKSSPAKTEPHGPHIFAYAALFCNFPAESEMRFSFLGVGNMGEPLAINLLKAGESLQVFTTRAACAAKFRAAGATVVQNPQDLANCDVLCTCLPLPEHLEKALLGKNGLHAAMSANTIHVDFSTIAPKTAEMLAEDAARHGIAYIQATVSKTPAIAAKGEAPLFVGGDQKAVEKLWPVLAKIAKPHNLQTIQASCAVKLISNLIGMSNVALVAEGLRIGQLAGINGSELLNLLLDTGCASFQMQTRGPWMLEGDFKARFSIDIAAKDLRLGCEMAKNWGYEPEMIGRTLAYLKEGQRLGIGGEDVAALYKIVKS